MCNPGASIDTYFWLWKYGARKEEKKKFNEAKIIAIKKRNIADKRYI